VLWLCYMCLHWFFFWIVLRYQGKANSQSLPTRYFKRHFNWMIYKLWWFFFPGYHSTSCSWQWLCFSFGESFCYILMLFVAMFLSADPSMYNNEKWRNVFWKFQLLLVPIFWIFFFLPYYSSSVKPETIYVKVTRKPGMSVKIFIF
jgi:hypothetical protein